MAADSHQIVHFILQELDADPGSIVARTAEQFSISRQAVLKRIQQLVASGVINAEGNTKARKYAIATRPVATITLPTAGLEEDIVYRKHVRPYLGELPDNIERICIYGFTEILNNAIDHSLSEQVSIVVSRTPSVVDFRICDSGIGIFRKIKQSLNLIDERHSLIELTKGKLTTDRSRHSGQGIFFTSRVFDHFSIQSGNLNFWHRARHDDWLTEDRTATWQGTCVQMWICVNSQTRLRDVFDKYAVPESEGFTKTHIPLRLAQSGEALVSRSQAKRILARIDEFEAVLLDFQEVPVIGQAFADEIFRVFRSNNPNVRVDWIHANKEVSSMIRRALEEFARDSGQPGGKGG